MRWTTLQTEIAGALAALLLAASPALAEETRIAEESAAILPLEGERSLHVGGIAGTVIVREGKEGELRFLSTAENDSKVELPIAVWRDGARLRLADPAAAPGVPPAARLLEITVPSRFAVTAELRRGRFSAFGITGGVRIEGEQLEVHGSSLGNVAIELRRGAVSLRATGEVELRGSGFDAKLENVEGTVDAVLEGGSLEVDGAYGLNLDVVRTRTVTDRIRGSATIRASEADLALSGIAAGLRANLERSPLSLEKSGGSLDLQTDAIVRFASLTGDLHVDGYGASVQGEGNTGIVEVKTDSAAVALRGIEGAVRVQGADLDLALVEIGGEVYVDTDDSTIRIENPSANVVVRNEFGDVEVSLAPGQLTIRSFGGDVRLKRISGPVDVEAAGPLVEVDWASMPASGDSVVRNDNGDVHVSFPPKGGCRVEARAEFGRIESDLPGVRVLDSGSEAQGVLGRRQRPLVRIASKGDVVLSGGGASSAEPP